MQLPSMNSLTISANFIWSGYVFILSSAGVDVVDCYTKKTKATLTSTGITCIAHDNLGLIYGSSSGVRRVLLYDIETKGELSGYSTVLFSTTTTPAIVGNNVLSLAYNDTLGDYVIATSSGISYVVNLPTKVVYNSVFTSATLVKTSRQGFLTVVNNVCLYFSRPSRVFNIRDSCILADGGMTISGIESVPSVGAGLGTTASSDIFFCMGTDAAMCFNSNTGAHRALYYTSQDPFDFNGADLLGLSCAATLVGCVLPGPSKFVPGNVADAVTCNPSVGAEACNVYSLSTGTGFYLVGTTAPAIGTGGYYPRTFADPTGNYVIIVSSTEVRLLKVNTKFGRMDLVSTASGPYAASTGPSLVAWCETNPEYFVVINSSNTTAPITLYRRVGDVLTRQADLIAPNKLSESLVSSSAVTSLGGAWQGNFLYLARTHSLYLDSPAIYEYELVAGELLLRQTIPVDFTYIPSSIYYSRGVTTHGDFLVAMYSVDSVNYLVYLTKKVDPVTGLTRFQPTVNPTHDVQGYGITTTQGADPWKVGFFKDGKKFLYRAPDVPNVRCVTLYGKMPTVPPHTVIYDIAVSESHVFMATDIGIKVIGLPMLMRTQAGYSIGMYFKSTKAMVLTKGLGISSKVIRVNLFGDSDLGKGSIGYVVEDILGNKQFGVMSLEGL